MILGVTFAVVPVMYVLWCMGRMPLGCFRWHHKVSSLYMLKGRQTSISMAAMTEVHFGCNHVWSMKSMHA